MFKLIETLRSKPSDKNICIIRIVFAFILVGVIYFGFEKTTWNLMQIPKEALYILYSFPLIGLVRGFFDPGVFRKKIWKWTQVGLGLTMMILSIGLIETDTSYDTGIVPSTISWEIRASSVSSIAPAGHGSVDTDFWMGFLGFFLAVGGLIFASKNITMKNERYGEIVKKIRI
jgi:hypothetical protein